MGTREVKSTSVQRVPGIPSGISYYMYIIFCFIVRMHIENSFVSAVKRNNAFDGGTLNWCDYYDIA